MSGHIPAAGAGAPAGGAPAGGAPAQAYQDDGGDYGDEVGEGNAGGLGGLEALANNPNFAAIRQRIIQDPNFYQQFMQQLQQTQPQIFAMIQANPGAFMNLILGGGAGAGVGAAGAGGAGAGAAGGADPPGTIRVS